MAKLRAALPQIAKMIVSRSDSGDADDQNYDRAPLVVVTGGSGYIAGYSIAWLLTAGAFALP